MTNGLKNLIVIFIAKTWNNGLFIKRLSRLFGQWSRLALLVLFLVVNVSIPSSAQSDSESQGESGSVGMYGFTNLSRDPGLDWIGDGILETLRIDLSRLGIAVIESPDLIGGTDQAPFYPYVPEAVSEIGVRLGLDWIVGGTYQRFGADLRITVHLTDVTASQGVVIRINGSQSALFALQDQVVVELNARLQVGLSGVGRVDVALPSDGGVPDALIGEKVSERIEVGEIPELVANAPPVPQAPEVIARSDSGSATIRALQIDRPLVLDGVLDEDIYSESLSLSGFIQTEPDEGAPATERTEVWLLFDEENVYVTFRCWDTSPESNWLANEMRRDNLGVFDNESITFLLDTFYDRRNGAFFMVNPVGGRIDAQVTNERNYNPDWNPVWDLKTGRFDGGWTVEASIPFKSLRYRPGRSQVWGFQARRVVRWKNEYSFLTPIPQDVGEFGTFQASLAASVVGLQAPEGGRTLEIKPYAIADLVTDQTTQPGTTNKFGGDVGLDVKYSLTQNLVADLTVNTDFAQVEADEQQVNLTRFSLFFPEKREFFLENQGLFAFGGAGTDMNSGGFMTGRVPILFYSREIGLDQGQEVPIEVGGRVTGRVGKFSLGAMSIRTSESPSSAQRATNFTVIRLKRDILRRSSIGVLFTGRSVSKRGSGSNEVYGVDGQFAFYDALAINTYWAKTRTPGLHGDDVSYRGQFNYAGDRYGVQFERLAVGRAFNPEVGFLARTDYDRSYGSLRFSPRPSSIAAIRRFSFQGQFEHIANRAGVLETQEAQGRFSIQFENGDRFQLRHARNYEFLEVPFQIASDVKIPTGIYRFQDTQVSYSFGSQRKYRGNLSLGHGSFFGGEKTSGGFTWARFELSQRISLEPGVSVNRINLPVGRFTTQLVTTRTTFTATPRMFLSALIQYNSSNESIGANVRLRWEYQPGSELFVVYNEQRDTLVPNRFSELQNRSFVVKINRLFRF
tara:strand:- start:3796 stop:6684 length:2889 start_codon:yes stop_codon:yes gene_type:complete